MMVMKFGGSSLSDESRIRTCVDAVKKALERRPVVVVSAIGRTTDTLLAACRRALQGKGSAATVRRLHLRLARDLGLPERLLEPLLFRLEALLRGVQMVGEVAPATLDRVLSFGERLSATLFAGALRVSGVDAEAVEAGEVGFLTDENHTRAGPLPGIERALGANLKRRRRLPVVTGFVGRTRRGRITTIGRNGSDYTASVIAASVGAEELQIWTDTPGLMSADPRRVPGAEPVDRLSYWEAAEVAHFGATVLHPKTLIPLLRKRIPLRILSTLRPDEPGTLIGPRGAGRVVVTRFAPVGVLSVRTHRISPILADLSAIDAALDDCGLLPLAMANSRSALSICVRQSGPAKRTNFRLESGVVRFYTPGARDLGARVRRFSRAIRTLAHVEMRAGCTLLCAVGKEEDLLRRSVEALADAEVLMAQKSGGAVLFVVGRGHGTRALADLHEALTGR